MTGVAAKQAAIIAAVETCLSIATSVAPVVMFRTNPHGLPESCAMLPNHDLLELQKRQAHRNAPAAV
jgi:hypothetical protein